MRTFLRPGVAKYQDPPPQGEETVHARHLVAGSANTQWSVAELAARETLSVPEFEQMQGALIRYPFGIPLSIVKEISQDVKAYVLCQKMEKNAVAGELNASGTNVKNVELVYQATDSVWVRDYGPEWVVQTVGGRPEIVAVDFTYNRPRPYISADPLTNQAHPNDNAVPARIASYLKAPLITSPLTFSGGNFMADGFGSAASTNLILHDNREMSREQVQEEHRVSFGAANMSIVADPHVRSWHHLGRVCYTSDCALTIFDCGGSMAHSCI